MKKVLPIIINVAILILLIKHAQAQCGSGASIVTTPSWCVSTGTMTITGATGIGILSYSISSSPTGYAYGGGFTTNNVFTSLFPGPYVVVVKDSSSGGVCSTSYAFSIQNNFIVPAFTVTSTPSTGCNNGTIQGIMSGGTSPYTYTISAGPSSIGATSTTGHFTGLAPGYYTISGSEGCQFVLTGSVTVPNAAWQITEDSITKLNCGQYRLNSVAFTVAPTLGNYLIKYNGNVLATSTTLPIIFSTPDSTIDSVQVCVTDIAGCQRCSYLSAPKWSITSATTSYTSCHTFTVSSVTIVGDTVGPVSYAHVSGPGDTTAWYSSIPFSFFHLPYNGYGKVIVKDACGVIKGEPFNGLNKMNIRLSYGLTFTSCTLGTITAYASGSFIPPLTYSLNGGPFTNTNAFPNLVDGTYTLAVKDACNDIAISTNVKLDHSWQTNGSAERLCTNGLFNNHVNAVYRMKAPITVKQYHTSFASIDATQTYTVAAGIFDAMYGLADSFSRVTFIGLANTTYTYIVTDSCGRSDTVVIVNGSNIHVPNTLNGTVQLLCNNKGKIIAHFSYDGPSTNSVFLSLWKTDTLSSPIISNFNTNATIGTITWGNLPMSLDTGTYIIKMHTQDCPEITYDTVTIEGYSLPILQNAIAFNCTADTINCVGWGNLGVPTYSYDIPYTVPVGGIKPIQTSNIFTLTGGPYTTIRMRIWDVCGNATTHEMAAAPPLPFTIHTLIHFPECNLDSLTLFVDSMFPGTTYQWENPAGIVLSTTTSLTMDPITIADTGIYICRIRIPGTCYDISSTFTLRSRDFGCYAKLGNRVWNDVNQNGITDANEVGVAGITVTLYDNINKIVGATVTDAYGYYLFNRLSPGSYHVGFSLPANYVFSSNNIGVNDTIDSDADPLSGLTGSYTLSVGDSLTTVDAGIHLAQQSGIGDYVWNDLNQNGVQDGNEFGMSGITVTLLNSAGSAVASTITDAYGHYYFAENPPGVYSLSYSAPIGYIFSLQNSGANDTTDSDVNPANGITSNFVLLAGMNNLTLDAGLHVQNASKSSLGNFVWYDVNQNGIQDNHEAGASGIRIILYASNGTTALDTTTSDELGYYIFNELSTGDYVIGFSNFPSGFSLTSTTVGNNTTDSDPFTATSKTGVIHLLPGKHIMSIDAGIRNPIAPSALIGHKVWYDYNEDGMMSANENGAPGVTVTLYGSNGSTVVQTTVTNQHGNYSFNYVPAGTYIIGFSNLPSGYILTKSVQGMDTTLDSNPDQVTGKTVPIMMMAAGVNLTVGAGLIKSSACNATVSLGDKVWLDLNHNGIQETAEEGMSGVTAILYDGLTNTVLASKMTDALGNCIFTGLHSGAYKIGYMIPTGFTFSTANSGMNDTIDSDVFSGGLTGVYYLTTGQDNLSIDAGIYPASNLAGLGNFVWNDLNQNGMQNANEPGVPGITVALFDQSNLCIMATTTDAKGAYHFSGLSAGAYYVEFTNLPSGFEFTYHDVGGDSVDNDADPLTGTTSLVTLAAGQDKLNLDAGIFSNKATLGNYVWDDKNNDGIKVVNETGMPGVTVTLYNSNGTVQVSSCITDANGCYSFVNLNPGTYLIKCSGIAEVSTFSIPYQGSDSTLDSNVDPLTGKTGSLVLSAGDYLSTIDAGISTPMASGLGNYVWLDSTANGTQDANELGVGGVTVLLYKANGMKTESTITDQNGFYSFPNLKSGMYSIEFTTLPDSAVFTASNASGNDSTDSDIANFVMNGAFHVSGRTLSYLLVGGVYNPSIDAGINPLPFALPVHVLQLEASLTGNIATIRWSTMDEKNLKNFSVQRSFDATRFTAIALPIAKGNTHGYSYYTIPDDVAEWMNSPVIYYRVVANDQDGNRAFSNLASIQPQFGNDAVLIYPTPFSTYLHIQYNSTKAANVLITLTDMNDRMVMNRKVFVEKGSNMIQLENLDNLANGTYFIYMNTDDKNQKYIKKLVKLK